ncbi:hypothetical protein SAMN05216223_11653 [Actinacidiphila yanglinensis]|uniref:Uncharacterized protein n=1 Tax=Actinacidiphila yanglinensis TaxID=310779 RepID=A0A1H6DL04_9ACTN|nr:hypothetical protein [Actinacidiphila yanglinensis]SEG85386.1 hypothetical protein SAMN05216223_11653 [Actinacidiphila yanglinensis]
MARSVGSQGRQVTRRCGLVHPHAWRSVGTPTTIDETAVDGSCDRALCRVLLQNAGRVLIDAEAEVAKNPVGLG